MEKTISMTQLANHTERIAKDIEKSGTVYRVKRPGHRAILLIDDQYFHGWLAAIEIMQRPHWRTEWVRASRDMAAGRGRDLEEILRELGREDPARSASRGSTRRAVTRRASKGRRRAPSAGRRSK